MLLPGSGEAWCLTFCQPLSTPDPRQRPKALSKGWPPDARACSHGGSSPRQLRAGLGPGYAAAFHAAAAPGSPGRWRPAGAAPGGHKTQVSSLLPSAAISTARMGACILHTIRHARQWGINRMVDGCVCALDGQSKGARLAGLGIKWCRREPEAKGRSINSLLAAACSTGCGTGCWRVDPSLLEASTAVLRQRSAEVPALGAQPHTACRVLARRAQSRCPTPPCRRTQRYEAHIWLDKKQARGRGAIPCAVCCTARGAAAPGPAPPPLRCPGPACRAASTAPCALHAATTSRESPLPRTSA